MATEMKYARVYLTEGDRLLQLLMDYLHNDAQVIGVTVVVLMWLWSFESGAQ